MAVLGDHDQALVTQIHEGLFDANDVWVGELEQDLKLPVRIPVKGSLFIFLRNP